MAPEQSHAGNPDQANAQKPGKEQGNEAAAAHGANGVLEGIGLGLPFRHFLLVLPLFAFAP